jgi:hypothetical protein
MRKLLISVSLAAAALGAAPAAAQYGGQGYDYRGGQNIDRQLDNLADRIRRAEDRDRISDREARRLFREVEQIDRLEDRYRRGGLTQWELRDLRGRIQNLRQQFRWERQEDRRGWDDRDDRRDDRNRWDDDDRWDDD